ncbi:MAG: FkbM family methyltransferase [Cyanobacteria bacterium P01_F01_bin.13]
MKKAIQSTLYKFGYQITKVKKHTSSKPKRYPSVDIFDLVINDYLRSSGKDSSEFNFVQIGAHDGVWCDPINNYVKKYHWHGLLVEPQLNAFKKLVENYTDEPQLKFENALILNQDKENVSLYTVRHEEGNEALFKLAYMARLDRDSLVRELSNFGLKNADSLVEAIKVPALTIPTLLDKHNIRTLDLLVIDTEGYDFEILKMFDLSKIRPAIIQLEIVHLSAEDKDACFAYLASHGYRTATVVFDAIAYLQSDGMEQNPGLEIKQLVSQLR